MLEFYALPGVAPACLRLQDTYNVDVVILLAALRSTALSRRLDAEQIRRIDRECAKWCDTVVRPLRSIRKAMKIDWDQTIEIQAQNLREDIKGTELRAEQVEVHMLEQLLDELPFLASSPHIRKDLQEVAEFVLDRHISERSEALPAEAILIIGSIADFFGHARQ